MRPRMPMNDQQLYRLLTWLSPAFPIGSFSYSHGLENAVEHGQVTDRESLLQWITAVINYGTARCDASIFCLVYAAINHPQQSPLSLETVVQYAYALQATAELKLEALAQGKSFLAAIMANYANSALLAVQQRLHQLTCEPTLAVAVAITCAIEGIALQLALTAYLQAFSAQLVSVGIRLIPLGQTQGQQIIALLPDIIQPAVAQAMQCSWEDIGSATINLELASMRHETQYTRLFRS